MGFFEKLFTARGQSAAQGPQAATSFPGLNMADVIRMISDGGIATSGSGVTVSRESALRLPAVYAAIRLLSSTIAALPLTVRMETEGGSESARDHFLYDILNLKPNPMMTSFVWRELSLVHLLTQGNAISVMARNGSGQVVGLYPVDAEQVEIIRKNGRKFYIVPTVNGSETWADEDVIHIPGLGFDGIRGLSPIRYFAREAIGQAQATQKHTSNFFKNGANLGSALQTDQNIPMERQNEILKNFKENFVGVENSKKVALLVDGLKYNMITISNEDAQLIETMKFQVTDIARIFGVPPHMIGDLEKATFSNIEQQSISFVQTSILPWVKRIEQELNTKLFAKQKYFARFNLDGLLRGDFATRMQGYSTALNAGMFTINEVREIEGFNRIEGGDTLRVPLNMAALTKDGFTAIE